MALKATVEKRLIRDRRQTTMRLKQSAFNGTRYRGWTYTSDINKLGGSILKDAPSLHRRVKMTVGDLYHGRMSIVAERL